MNEDIEDIRIMELDPDSINPSFKQTQNRYDEEGGSKITIIARPGGGKSRMLLSLLYEKRHCFPAACLVSGTEDSNKFFRKHFADTFIHDELTLELLTNFKLRQKASKEHINNSWAVLVLDDCTDDPSIFNKPVMQGLYKNGRHWRMLFVLSLQYCLDIKPVIRSLIDGVFLLREPNINNRKKLYDNYASIIPSFKLFCKIMDEITNDYTALYINNRTQSNDWRQCIFWYRAKEIPEDFRFGSDDYNDFHANRYNDSFVDY